MFEPNFLDNASVVFQMLNSCICAGNSHSPLNSGCSRCFSSRWRCTSAGTSRDELGASGSCVAGSLWSRIISPCVSLTPCWPGVNLDGIQCRNPPCSGEEKTHSRSRRIRIWIFPADSFEECSFRIKQVQIFLHCRD